jgi:hypothetical protein
MDTDFYRDRLRAIRARDEVSLVIRRGATNLASQAMRIVMAGPRGARLQSDAARAATQAVFILGEYNMDIQPEDRLTYESHLIKVVFIQLNRTVGTIAEGIIEQ